MWFFIDLNMLSVVVVAGTRRVISVVVVAGFLIRTVGGVGTGRVVIEFVLLARASQLIFTV